MWSGSGIVSASRIRPSSTRASGSRALAWNSLLCAHRPTYSVTGACGFNARMSRNSRPDSSRWSLTIRSCVLHQMCSGTPERAIARAQSIGLRSCVGAASPSRGCRRSPCAPAPGDRSLGGGEGTRNSARACPCPSRARPRRRADADGGRRAGASPAHPCCCRRRRSGARSTCSHGSFRREDRRHPREIVDLAVPAPGVARQHAALTLRADDGERPERRQAAPEVEVGAGLDPAAVRRDDEWQDRIAMPRVPARQEHVGRPRSAVPGPVPDRHAADEPLLSLTRSR